MRKLLVRWIDDPSAKRKGRVFGHETSRSPRTSEKSSISEENAESVARFVPAPKARSQ